MIIRNRTTASVSQGQARFARGSWGFQTQGLLSPLKPVLTDLRRMCGEVYMDRRSETVLRPMVLSDVLMKSFEVE